MTAPLRTDPTTVKVALDARSYDIVVGRGLIGSLGPRIAALRPGAKTAIVTDEDVARHHLGAAEASLAAAGVPASRVIVPVGEGSKSFHSFERVCETLIAERIERGDLVVALGGGVIGDLAGFAASVVRRGIDYVQVPTTLLAQVNSSVGGKTAINSVHGKNLIGTFHQPILVLADTALLDSLPPRQFRAGYAELVKYGLLGDAAFFAWLEANWREVFAGGSSSGGFAREHAIAVSCRAKAAIVARDERETGERALLNLGHTFGHALEAACGFSDRLLHGESVAAGMALAFGFSARLGTHSRRRGGTRDTPFGGSRAAHQNDGYSGQFTFIGSIDGFDCTGQESETWNAYIYPSARHRRRFRRTRRRSSAGARVPQRETCRAMSIHDWLIVAAVVVCLLISAFYSGSETALTASSRAAMMRLEKQGNVDATIVSRLLATRERFLGAVLLANNATNIAASTLATGLLLTLFGEAGVIYATIVMTALIFILCEILPKTAAFNAPDRVALVVAQPIARTVTLLLPLLKAVEWMVRLILRGIGMSRGTMQSILSPREELRGAVDLLHRAGIVEKLDRDMMGGVLDLRELTVSDVMVHRTKMVMLDADTPPREIVDAVLGAAVSRLPVWRGSPDNILGVLYAKDLLRALHSAGGDASKIDIETLARPPWFVPDTTPLYEQLKAFRDRKTPVALVVDEYGELEGLVTTKDIIAEIVGDIGDEHEVAVPGVRMLADGSANVDGSVPVRDLNRAMDWSIPDDEATTIAGVVIHESRSIPEPGQSFTFHGYRFQVLRKTRNRITALRVTPLVRKMTAKAGTQTSTSTLN